jgi:hypothetical protein
MATSKAVDFSNVKDGGGAFNRNRVPAGDYIATVTKVEDAPSKKDDVFQFLFSIKIDKYPTRTFPYYCKLQDNQLWKLRNLLIAAGLQVPKRKVKVDPNKAVGKRIGITLEDADFDGKEQSEVAAVFPAAELADGNQVADDDDFVDDEDVDDVEDDTEEVADEPEEDEEDEADPYADLDRTALKAELKKRDASFVAKKSQTDDDLRDLLRAGDGGDDEADEEEEPEPAPAPRRRSAKAASKTVTDEDLEDLDIDDL